MLFRHLFTIFDSNRAEKPLNCLLKYIEGEERTQHEMARVRIVTGEEVERNGRADTGVDYEDPVEVSWGMRLNDPDSGDEIFSREVLFWVKTGNVIASGVVDPGGGEGAAFPDFPPNQGDEDFTDLIFNWQDAGAML